MNDNKGHTNRLFRTYNSVYKNDSLVSMDTLVEKLLPKQNLFVLTLLSVVLVS